MNTNNVDLCEKCGCDKSLTNNKTCPICAVEDPRKDVLLRATYDILKKCATGPYVKNALEETAFYDDTDCDGFCLMEDIASELGIDE